MAKQSWHAEHHWLFTKPRSCAHVSTILTFTFREPGAPRHMPLRSYFTPYLSLMIALRHVTSRHCLCRAKVNGVSWLVCTHVHTAAPALTVVDIGKCLYCVGELECDMAHPQELDGLYRGLLSEMATTSYPEASSLDHLHTRDSDVSSNPAGLSLIKRLPRCAHLTPQLMGHAGCLPVGADETKAAGACVQRPRVPASATQPVSVVADR